MRATLGLDGEIRDFLRHLGDGFRLYPFANDQAWNYALDTIGFAPREEDVAP